MVSAKAQLQKGKFRLSSRWGYTAALAWQRHRLLKELRPPLAAVAASPATALPGLAGDEGGYQSARRREELPGEGLSPIALQSWSLGSHALGKKAREEEMKVFSLPAPQIVPLSATKPSEGLLKNPILIL